MTSLVTVLTCFFVKIKIHNSKPETGLYPTVICAT